MIKITRTLTRIDETAPWHLEEPFRSNILTQEFLSYVDTTYAGKQTNQAWTRSDDKLQITFTSAWQSLEDYETYLNDPICLAMFARRDAHNAQYGIVAEPRIIQET
jgi:hypothetical protein